ncbi:MAG TPA: glycosyltransferase family 4 protein [Gaiellaceae bacterium]|nr:glycosyltransferase family 4 protein [Gaiellaceae bacterium]
MRRIVFITQVVDPTDANLGATRAKIAALARRVDEVAVLCDRGIEGVLPDNCRVHVFGARTRPQRAARYISALRKELRDPKPVAVVGHMVPLYTLVAAPFVRAKRVPLMLWYTHWKGHIVLRLAIVACTHLLSLDVRSFPLRSRKVHAIGHGIDVNEFPCQPSVPAAGRPFRVMSLGRYSPPKKLDEMVEGVRIARDRGLDVRIDLYGTASPGLESSYKRELEKLVARPEYKAFASVYGPIPRTELPPVYANADIVASDFISPDKIVLEACSSCRPVIASHESFDTLFVGIEPPLAFVRGRPETFADRIEALAALSDDARHTIGETLRERVRTQHSVETWAGAIVRLSER